MNKILISNIGNRNLKLDGKFISKIFDADENISFREQTFFIWEQIQKNSCKGLLEPVILNEVIEKEKVELKKVILFSSDMPDTMRNDQDTIFEGEILCYILKQFYPEIEFINVPFHASVFVHDELFLEYHRYLSKMKNEYFGFQIIYCDAGGTSQQKFAVKISLEYLFEPIQFIVYYVAQEQKGKSTIMRGESYEYRKIIDKEHAIQAINSSSYQLANKLLTEQGFQKTGMIHNIIMFLDFRSRFLLKEAQHSAMLLNKGLNCPEFVKNYLHTVPLGNYNGWENILTNAQFFQLCEILSIVQWKFTLGIIEQGIHFFSMFIENYIYYSLSHTFNYQFDVNYEKAYAKLIEDFEAQLINLPSDIDPNKKGLPTLIELTSQIIDFKNVKITQSIKNLNSRTSKKQVGIDTLRNNYAHKGKGVNRESLEKRGFVEGIKECFEVFGMDFNRNYFAEMHSEVCELIRNE